MKNVNFVIYGFVIGHFIRQMFKKLTFKAPTRIATKITIRYVKGGEYEPEDEVVVTMYPGNITQGDYLRFLMCIATLQPARGWRMTGGSFAEGVPVAMDASSDWSGLDRCLAGPKEVQKFHYDYSVITEPDVDPRYLA